MTEKLPALMDCRAIMDEMGVKRTVAEAWMRELPKITPPDTRRVFVRRTELLELVERHTQRGPSAQTARPAA